MAGSQVLPPGTDGPASDCAGQVPIVVGADAAAQSDLYSAATLAGVIETTCIVLAGPRDGEMDAAQVARLDAALGSSGAQSGGGSEAASGDRSTTGWVMGGEAAVPEAKVAGRGLKRLNGVDRWHTARLAGAIAVGPDGDVAALTAATAPVAGEPGGTAVMVDGAEVRLPPGLDADCAGQVPIVVAADAAAQSDLYSAATLAGVLDTTCIVLAGARGEPMSAEQQARLGAATGARSGAPDGANGRAADTDSAIEGWIVGGTAAVPDAKVAGYSLTRIGGADRWSTARLIGEAAVAQAARDVAEATTTTTEARSTGGSSGGGSARSSGGGGGSSRRVSSGGGGGVSRPPAVPSTGPSSDGSPAGTTTTTSTTMPGDGGNTSPTAPGDTSTSTTEQSPGDPTSPTAPGPDDSTSTTTSVPGGGGAQPTEPADTTTTVPGDSTGTTQPGPGDMTGTTQPVPGDMTGTTVPTNGPAETTTTTQPGAPATTVPDDTTTTTSEPPPSTTTTTTEPPMASMFTPTVNLEVPQLAGVSGDNIWAMRSFEVTVAPAGASVSEPDCSPRAWVTFRVEADGSVMPVGSQVPASLIGTTAGGVACSYAVTFPPPPTDAADTHFSWTMTAPAAGSLSAAKTSAAGAYTVGAVTFDPDATITVPSGNDGAAFDVEFASAQRNCSGTGGSPATLTYTVPTGGTTAQPDTASNPPLIAYPQGATASTPVCSYTVTFPPNESGGTTLVLQTTSPALDTTVTGTDQAVSATYVPALTGVSSGETFSCALALDGAVSCWGDNHHGQITVPTLRPGVTYTQVSAGRAHACALTTDGTIACWGDNTDGQATAPDPPQGATFTSVDAARWHSCGLTSAGSIECWGRNTSGQTTVPTLATGVTFTQVSAGQAHSCAVRSDRSVVCWGESVWSTLVSETPTTGSFTSVSTGVGYACGVKADESVQCWGWDSQDQASPPAGSFVSVSAGLRHACGVRSGGASDGAVECWGSNAERQTAVPSGSFAEVSAGDVHSCGVKTDGSVTCWGYGDFNQAASSPGTFAALTAGWYHTCGISTDDAARCWGINNRMQLTVPALAPGESFTQLSAGESHSCGLKSDNTVACWGFDGFAGFEDGRVSMMPEGSFAAVTAGRNHSCGIRSGGSTDGEIVCWGADDDGRRTPPGLGPGEAFTAVAAGSDHTCAIKSDDTLACWGYNGFPVDGRVSDTPSGATDLFASLAVGDEHACAVRVADSSIACWGNDDAGQSTPPAGAFAAVAAGEEHTCGVRSGGTPGGAAAGTVVCWGSNNAGQTDAPEGTFASLAAGRFHTCGIRSDGAASDNVVCWGAGTQWQRITARPPNS